MEISSRVSILSSGNLRRKLEKKLEDLYRKEIKQIGKDLNIGVSFGQSDKNITPLYFKVIFLNALSFMSTTRFQEILLTSR